MPGLVQHSAITAMALELVREHVSAASALQREGLLQYLRPLPDQWYGTDGEVLERDPRQLAHTDADSARLLAFAGAAEDPL